ncbi:MAG: hypothetical protein LBU30_04470 [Candidatus Methanoplasma sp.]|jgi:hypothetical protein|nr:hypothetical protein [Candidatus Methanoplasma sp.]
MNIIRKYVLEGEETPLNGKGRMGGGLISPRNLAVILAAVLFATAALAAVYESDDSDAANIIPIGSYEDLIKIGDPSHPLFPLNGDYMLTADIQAAGEIFVPIGTSSTPFTGTFDGDGHVIENLTIESGRGLQQAGLFGYVNGATISNLGMVGGSINADQSAVEAYAGGIAAYAYASSGTTIIDNCYNTGAVSATTAGPASYSGGIVGYANAELGAEIKIDNCYNTGLISAMGTAYNSYSGGIVGYANATSGAEIKIENCYNTNNVSATAGTSSLSNPHSGGIVGYAYADSSGATTIVNCYNTGAVLATGTLDAPFSYSGGIAGFARAGTVGGAINIWNCHNTGVVSATASVNTSYSYSGGIVGYVYADSGTGTIIIENCYNTNSVLASGTGPNSRSYSGGIAGYVSADPNTPIIIRNCYNTGEVSAQATLTQWESHSGGIVGHADAFSTNSTITIENCYNTGEVSATAKNMPYSGGIVGKASVYGGAMEIENCYNAGVVSAEGAASNKRAGGIAGFANGTGNFITSSYYLEGKLVIEGSLAVDKLVGNQTSAATGTYDGDEFRTDGHSTFKTDGEKKVHGTYVDWDFGSSSPIWGIDASGIINDGFPYLFPLGPLGPRGSSYDGWTVSVDYVNYTGSSTPPDGASFIVRGGSVFFLDIRPDNVIYRVLLNDDDVTASIEHNRYTVDQADDDLRFVIIVDVHLTIRSGTGGSVDYEYDEGWGTVSPGTVSAGGFRTIAVLPGTTVTLWSDADAGYVFDRWDGISGIPGSVLDLYSFTLNGDAEIRAVYDARSGGGGSGGNGNGGGNGSGSGGGSGGNDNGGDGDNGVVSDVSGNGVSDGEWAVMNLVFAILAIISGIIALIAGRDLRRDADDGTGNGTEERPKTSFFLRIAAFIIGIASIIIFFLTEDMSLTPIPTDSWTLLSVILLIIVLIMTMVSFRTARD